MRIALAKLLLGEPNCCCSTSPPTTSTRGAQLARGISNAYRPVILVSHDRFFLEGGERIAD